MACQKTTHTIERSKRPSTTPQHGRDTGPNQSVENFSDQLEGKRIDESVVPKRRPGADALEPTEKNEYKHDDQNET